jgi:hypothetical protein
VEPGFLKEAVRLTPRDARPDDERPGMSYAANEARKVVTEFELIFGDLTATEGDWLFEKIKDAIQSGRQAAKNAVTAGDPD